MSNNEEFLLSQNRKLWDQLHSLADYTNELRLAVKNAGIPVPPPHVVKQTGVRVGQPLRYGSMEEEEKREKGIRVGQPLRYGSMEEEERREREWGVRVGQPLRYGSMEEEGGRREREGRITHHTYSQEGRETNTRLSRSNRDH